MISEWCRKMALSPVLISTCGDKLEYACKEHCKDYDECFDKDQIRSIVLAHADMLDRCKEMKSKAIEDSGCAICTCDRPKCESCLVKKINQIECVSGEKEGSGTTREMK